MAHKMLEKSLAYYINGGMENHRGIRVRHIRHEDNHMINDVNPIRDINEGLDEMGARLERMKQKLKGMSK